MLLFKKVKNWITEFFKKGVSEVREVGKLVDAEASTPFLEEVRERLAISPRDLCDHDFAKKQIWTRISPKQFELQNEITCVKCNDCRVEAIR